MDITRNCPVCEKVLTYSYQCRRDAAEKKGSLCRSCSTKQQYQDDPLKNKGKNNGRTGKKLLDVFQAKYGVTVGSRKYKAFTKGLVQRGFKKGKDNPSYGKVPTNSGRSYKGWYKGLFFRSSLELLFILDFESTTARLPLSAEGAAFRVKYRDKTYCPDFFDPATRTVFEVKCSIFIDSNQDKFQAAIMDYPSRGLVFKIVTDTDLSYNESRVLNQLSQWSQDGTITLTDISQRKLSQRLSKR